MAVAMYRSELAVVVRTVPVPSSTWSIWCSCISGRPLDLGEVSFLLFFFFLFFLSLSCLYETGYRPEPGPILPRYVSGSHQRMDLDWVPAAAAASQSIVPPNRTSLLSLSPIPPPPSGSFPPARVRVQIQAYWPFGGSIFATLLCSRVLHIHASLPRSAQYRTKTKGRGGWGGGSGSGEPEEPRGKIATTSMSRCIFVPRTHTSSPSSYWSDLSQEIFPSRTMHPPMLLEWSLPGLSGHINWQRDTPAHQEGHTLSRIYQSTCI
ncbi:hypothetical protein QBC35DRAFT_540347 [Podospora australis]|uniref:Uncharacterized protein n=1 Tax=Podospora australis TaxID=1536484 RepID=A0AAN6WZ31_9PEZI|nr:hypothetical protein QBC35DRAFT_540347 [Podospora australis]